MIEHVYKPDGHCERCGQTPCTGDAFTDFMFGRSKNCLTDEQLSDVEIYYRTIQSTLDKETK